MPPWSRLSKGDQDRLAGDQTCGGGSSHDTGTSPLPSSPSQPSLPVWFGKLPVELHGSPRLLDIAKEASAMSCIAFDLPPPNVSAGRVLDHCINVLEKTFRKWDPCIHKIGWTHNPIWRWGNSLYGYAKQKDQWSNMIVLHIAGEPFSTAMLEAALIKQYQSILSALLFQF